VEKMEPDLNYHLKEELIQSSATPQKGKKRLGEKRKETFKGDVGESIVSRHFGDKRPKTGSKKSNSERRLGKGKGLRKKEGREHSLITARGAKQTLKKNQNEVNPVVDTGMPQKGRPHH